MGQKTSPLILRKQYKIAELAQYYYGKTGHFFFHTENTIQSNLKQFFKRQKSKLDQVTILQNEKKIQILINFTLNKKRYKKIRFKQKKRKKRIKKLLKRFKRYKRGCYKRRRRWKQRLNFLRPKQIFFKDFWKKQYLFQTSKITQFCNFFKGLKKNPSWLQNKSKKFLQTQLFKTTNLKKKFINKLYRKYLKILTAKIITLSFQFYFLQKILKYINMFSKISIHISLKKNFKKFITFWCQQVTLPISGLTLPFRKLTFKIQQKILKTPKLSKSFIKKYFFYAKATKANIGKKNVLISTYTNLNSTKLQIIKKNLGNDSKNQDLLLKYQRLITTKLIFKFRKRIKQKVLNSYYRFRKYKYKYIYKKKGKRKKKFGFPIILYSRALFRNFKRLARKPNLWTRFFFHDRFTYHWYFNYYNTLKPQVNINAVRFLKIKPLYAKSKSKQPIIKKTKEEKKQAKEAFKKLPMEKKIRIKRRQMAKKRKIREIKEFRKARYQSYLTFQKLFYARIRKNLSFKVSRRRHKYARRKGRSRRRKGAHKLRKTKPIKYICGNTFTHTRKQQLFSWKFYYNTIITTQNISSEIYFRLKKTTYRKRLNKRIKHRFYRYHIRKTRRKKVLRRLFYKNRCRFKKRKFLLRPYLRRKTKFFKICSFVYFFNKKTYKSIVPTFITKINKKIHFQRFKGRRRLIRGIQNYKKRRIHKFNLVKKQKNKLLKLWKKMLRNQNWFKTKKFHYYRSKKQLHKRQLLSFSKKSSTLDLSEITIQTSLLNYLPEKQTSHFENLLFWKFMLTSYTLKKTNLLQKYSLISWTGPRVQKCLKKTYLNKKLLYFRLLALKYKRFLKKKKYFSILFFKKLLKKILHKTHCTRAHIS